MSIGVTGEKACYELYSSGEGSHAGITYDGALSIVTDNHGVNLEIELGPFSCLGLGDQTYEHGGGRIVLSQIQFVILDRSSSKRFQLPARRRTYK